MFGFFNKVEVDGEVLRLGKADRERERGAIAGEKAAMGLGDTALREELKRGYWDNDEFDAGWGDGLQKVADERGLTA